MWSPVRIWLVIPLVSVLPLALSGAGGGEAIGVHVAALAGVVVVRSCAVVGVGKVAADVEFRLEASPWSLCWMFKRCPTLRLPPALWRSRWAVGLFCLMRLGLLVRRLQTPVLLCTALCVWRVFCWLPCMRLMVLVGWTPAWLVELVRCRLTVSCPLVLIIARCPLAGAPVRCPLAGV